MDLLVIYLGLFNFALSGLVWLGMVHENRKLRYLCKIQREALLRARLRGRR